MRTWSNSGGGGHLWDFNFNICFIWLGLGLVCLLLGPTGLVAASVFVATKAVHCSEYNHCDFPLLNVQYTEYNTCGCKMWI